MIRRFRKIFIAMDGEKNPFFVTQVSLCPKSKKSSELIFLFSLFAFPTKSGLGFLIGGHLKQYTKGPIFLPPGPKLGSGKDSRVRKHQALHRLVFPCVGVGGLATSLSQQRLPFVTVRTTLGGYQTLGEGSG